MSFIRARQRVITALHPHQGNRNFIVPKRGRLNPLQQAASAAWIFTDGTLVDKVNALSPVFTRGTQAGYFDVQRLYQVANVDQPRFDHNPETGKRLGLLIEEERSNICLESLTLDQAPWSTTNASIDPDLITAPDGKLAGDKLVENTSDAEHRVNQALINSDVPGVFTIFAKAGERDTIRLRIGSAPTQALFNLATGVAEGSSPGTMQAVGNGWYRCGVKVNAPGVNQTVRVSLFDGTGITYQGDGVSGAYLWGGQYEEADFATSFIVTAGAPVTREADECITTDVSWLVDGIGSIYTQADLHSVENPDSFIYELNNGGGNHRIAGGVRMAGSANGVYAFWGRNVADTQWFITWNGVGNFEQFKTAGAYQTNDTASYYNGAQGTPDVLADMPLGMTQLQFGRSLAANTYLNGHIASLVFFPIRLPNNVLDRITI